MKRFSFHLSYSHLLLILFSFCAFTADSEASTRYTVKKGDSLSSISKKYHVSIDDLKKANTTAKKKLNAGDKLIIPEKHKAVKNKQSAKRPLKGSIAKKNAPAEQNDEVKKAELLKTNKLPENIYHLVKKGDTLSSVSRTYSISLAELSEINGLRKTTKLKKGQKLIVGSVKPNVYTVKKGDTIPSIAKKFKMEPEEIMTLNELQSANLNPGQQLYLEEDQSAVAEIEKKEIVVTLEEELKTASESPELAELGLQDKVMVFAKKLLNIPYKFGGNSILGIDCSAYVKKVYGLLGIDLPRTAREQFNEGELIEKEKLSIGDLVFFRTYASFPSHVGIYLGNDLFIHASEKGKKVKVDNLEAPYFVKRFIGAKRLLKDESEPADSQN